MPSPKRPAPEKIAAVATVYRALVDELPDTVLIGDEGVQASLIQAATIIAMGSQTQDMGILAGQPVPAPPLGVDSDKADWGSDDIEAFKGEKGFEETLLSYWRRHEGARLEDVMSDIGRLIHAAGGRIEVPDATAVRRFEVTISSTHGDPLASSVVWTARERRNP